MVLLGGNYVKLLNQGSKVFILDIQKQKSKNNSIFLRLTLQKKMI